MANSMYSGSTVVRLCMSVTLNSLQIMCILNPVAGVLDESYSQLTPLSGVAAQARQST